MTAGQQPNQQGQRHRRDRNLHGGNSPSGTGAERGVDRRLDILLSEYYKQRLSAKQEPYVVGLDFGIVLTTTNQQPTRAEVWVLMRSRDLLL